jgi:hypothetical protein
VIDVPVTDGDDPREYITQAEKSRLERLVMHHMRKVEGDVTDIEVMDATIIPDEEAPRERGDDDGVEYSDPRDVR